MSDGGGEENQGEEEASKISEAMLQPLPRPLFYSRRRRPSQHASAQRQEELHRPGSDHDLKLKSISCEPTTTEACEVDTEEEEEEDEEEEEEETEEEEEEEVEESMEDEKEFAEHRQNWDSSYGKGSFGLLSA
jgi:hypothetical protein